MTERGHSIEILLVEDNNDDVVLTKEALKEGKIKNVLNVVKDGEEALDYLFRRGAYKNVTRPDIVLLDLNMPRKDGREVLQEIKKDAELKTIPVVVLTTSDAETDVIKSYKLNANCYIVKPVDLDKFISVIKVIEEFWLDIVRLPGRK